MYIAVGLVLLCVVLAVWSTWIRQKPDAPPMMPGFLPIIGHSHLLIGDRKHLWKYIKYFTLTSLKYGGTLEIWFGLKRHYVLTDPDDCLKLANTCYSKSYIYDFAKDFINNGLITADAATWKVNRKLLNPAFNQQVLDTFINEMNIQARNVVSNLKNELENESFDVLRHIVSFTLSTVSRTSLGLTDEDQKIIDTDYAAAIDSIFALYCDRFQKVWLHLNFIFNWSEIKRKQDRLLKILHNIMIPLIAKRKSELSTKREPTYYEDRPGKFKPILDQMLQMASDHGVFSDEDIREHLDTLVAASYDTTSSAMTHMLLAIATYPEIQNKIYNEIQEVLQNKDDDFTKHDLQKLVYLEAVMKESLRLHSATPLIGRNIDVDVKLKNCTIRANSTSIIGVYALHRHPLWGPDANEFKPERWLDPSISSLLEKPALFAAFGIGKRNCIGKTYSMLMMKIVLAHIVRQYHISGDIHKVVCEFDIVLKPVSGHHIGLKLRS
ncbi:cytochrome P450 4d8-like [Spodoptera litura]|uniref:Cytochrome P450 4d8-like n=1 Tax=Spodoptera litura TaxID=69820 RepID=A0A9J7IT95_SPOLT|nr:cytochrome P450 4d8-like [Spodoptera litura]